MPNLTIKEDIIARALAEGFDVVRFTDGQAAAGNRAGLESYLAAGHHGSMDWMEARKDERAAIARAIDDGLDAWPALAAGDFERAMLCLHTRKEQQH